MKKGISLALALALALGLTACSTGGDDTRSTGSPSPAVESPAAGTEAPSAPETVTITSLNADKEAVELEVPYDPQRIAILDMASFEFVVEKNPDYIFVMDRDAAIQTDGAQLAQEIMENELVMGTDAYKNGNIVYLAHPAVWYTAEGGITALDIMLQDLESELLG